MLSPESRLGRLEKKIPPPPVTPTQFGALPNIIDFVISPEYLKRPRLYPGQATVLKVVFLADDLFTEYDYRRLDAWGVGGATGLETNRQYGVASDLLSRIRANKAAGRRWFRYVMCACGRRGGKGYLGSVSVAYVIWIYLSTGDPQEHFGIAPGKPLTVPVWAQSKDQSRDVFWRDLVAVIKEAPCFEQYIAEERADKLSLWSPRQLAQPAASRGAPAIEIVARESTESAARGYASPVQVHDEMAHAIATGSARSAEDIHESTEPAQTQFGIEAFTYAPSSPRERIGRFYELHSQGLEINPDGTPTNPEILSLQFPSWELYEDWESWESIPLYPGGPTSAPIQRAIITESDPEIQRVRRTNPEMYRVEYLAHWAEVQIPFLAREHVLAITEPFDGRQPETQMSGQRKHRYYAHGDLSLTGDNTVLMVAHGEMLDDSGRPHHFIDYAEHWSPSDFPAGHIDLTAIETIADQLLVAFPTTVSLTFDSYQSAGIIERLRRNAQSRGTHTHIGEFSPNRKEQLRIARIAKAAIYERRVHAPDYPLMIDELLYLEDQGDRVDHPSSGPVITDDYVTCLFAVIAKIEEATTQDPAALFANTPLSATSWHISPADRQVHDALSLGNRRYLGSAGGARRQGYRH